MKLFIVTLTLAGEYKVFIYSWNHWISFLMQRYFKIKEKKVWLISCETRLSTLKCLKNRCRSIENRTENNETHWLLPHKINALAAAYGEHPVLVWLTKRAVVVVFVHCTLHIYRLCIEQTRCNYNINTRKVEGRRKKNPSNFRGRKKCGNDSFWFFVLYGKMSLCLTFHSAIEYFVICHFVKLSHHPQLDAHTKWKLTLCKMQRDLCRIYKESEKKKYGYNER